MKILMIQGSMILLISILLIILVNLTSKKSFTDREKSSPFECGFDPKSSARLPFSLKFFLIAMIFLIFDVEITLLLPMVLVLTSSSVVIFSAMMVFFFGILILGLMHEWKQGALEWAQ
uniref:NADH-ubiquinone oxidoreductase chain 3 n=1 Tax=Epipedocera atra TaxID=2763313 RepID=A0A7G7WQ91_9CUCU|nr:NADH dehydrogenase subunit 3 [Epipedocera atra]QNH68718.1 NADH dehydrogenase subunit 3 [Epipedocera atra]